jgi:hypothetical protein
VDGGPVDLALGLAVLGFIFVEEVTAAVRTWDRSTAYNHCWLVLRSPSGSPGCGGIGWRR